MALPSSLSMKSWTRTSSGSPWGCHSWPPFLKSPTSSFFLVSTEITGWPRRWNTRTSPLMCSNWALRSGCDAPSRVLRLPCKLYPAARSRRRTVLSLTGCPWPVNSRAKARVLLQVQQRGIRIAPGHGVYQPLQGRNQFRVLRGLALPPTPRLAQARRDRQVGLRGLGRQLGLPTADGRGRQAGGVSHSLNTAPAIGRGLRRGPLASHPLVHDGLQRTILRLDPLDGECVLHHRVKIQNGESVNLF